MGNNDKLNRIQKSNRKKKKIIKMMLLNLAVMMPLASAFCGLGRLVSDEGDHGFGTFELRKRDESPATWLDFVPRRAGGNRVTGKVRTASTMDMNAVTSITLIDNEHLEIEERSTGEFLSNKWEIHMADDELIDFLSTLRDEMVLVEVDQATVDMVRTVLAEAKRLQTRRRLLEGEC